MTTICWDGRYLAADTRQCTAGSPSGEETKLLYRGSVVYASSGPTAWFRAWVDWCEAGSDPNGQLPVTGLEGHQGGFIRLDLQSRVCEMLDFRLPYFSPAPTPWSWGSGGDYALGALAVGVTAMEAVRAAIRWDVNSGGDVDFVDLEFTDRGVQRWDGLMPSAKFPMPVKDGLTQEERMDRVNALEAARRHAMAQRPMFYGA